MNNIVNNVTTVLMNGQKYFFRVNEDLTISRWSEDNQNWEVIDFTAYIGQEANENGSIRNTGELTSVELKNDGNHLIMVTNIGNYVAEGGAVIGDSWFPIN